MPRKVDVNALLVSEVLKKVSNAKTKKEKIDLLQTYSTQALRSILIWNYDEQVQSMLPEEMYLTILTKHLLVLNTLD